jgi:NTP pyrophosphatase (non-canonical NTP hydrolase)
MTSDHLNAIAKRYGANQRKWAGYHRTPADHLLIAAEELGEVSRSMQTFEGRYVWPPRYTPTTYEELVDLGAVVLAMMNECEPAS